MKIVADTNVLFSFFWKYSTTKKLISSINFEIISPEKAINELNKHADEIIKKTGIKEKEFKEYLDELKIIISFVNEKEYSSFFDESIEISPDKNDAHFFALCLKESCFLWSNDYLLKQQNKVKVLSTEDIIEILF